MIYRNIDDVTVYPSDTSLGAGTVPYLVNVKHPQAQLQSFLADNYSHVWDGSLRSCLYAGSFQGGPTSVPSWSHLILAIAT